MDDWLSKEWADHHARFGADLSRAIDRVAIGLRGLASAGFWRKTRTDALGAARWPRVGLRHQHRGVPASFHDLGNKLDRD